MNQDHWTMLLSQSPKLRHIDIECRDQPIKIDAVEKYNQKTEVKAMHIIRAKEKLAHCQKAMKSLHNKSAQEKKQQGNYQKAG
jgi:nitrogenase subunit NifH